MKKIKLSALLIAAVLLLLSFAGCKKPIPPEQLAIDVYNAANEISMKNKQVDSESKITVKFSDESSSMEFVISGYSKDFYDENEDIKTSKQYQQTSIYGSETKVTQTFIDGIYYYNDETNKYMSALTLEDWKTYREENGTAANDFKAEDFANRNCTFDKEEKTYLVELSEPSDSLLTEQAESFEVFADMFLVESKLSDMSVKLITDEDKCPKKMETSLKFDGSSDSEGDSVEIFFELNITVKDECDITAPSSLDDYIDVGDAMAIEKISNAAASFTKKTSVNFKHTADTTLNVGYDMIFSDENTGKYTYSGQDFTFEVTERVNNDGTKDEYTYSYKNGKFTVKYGSETQSQNISADQARDFVFSNFLEDLAIDKGDIKYITYNQEKNCYVVKLDDYYIDYYAERALGGIGLYYDEAENVSCTLEEQIIVLDENGDISKIESAVTVKFKYYGDNVKITCKWTTEILVDSVNA